jgi:hypothetical protein
MDWLQARVHHAGGRRGAIVLLNGSDNVTGVSLFVAVRGDHDRN